MLSFKRPQSLSRLYHSSPRRIWLLVSASLCCPSSTSAWATLMATALAFSQHQSLPSTQRRVPTGFPSSSSSTRLFSTTSSIPSLDTNNHGNSDNNSVEDDEWMNHITDEMWLEYCTLMQDIMARDRVVKKSKPEILPSVQAYLLEPQFQSIPSLQADDGVNDFRQVSRDRHEHIVGHERNWSKAQAEYLQRCLSYTADWCAKKQLVTPALVAWLKLRELSLVPRENTVSTFLFVLTSSMTDERSTMNSLLAAAAADVASFHDLCFEPNEKTIYLRVKSLIAHGQAGAAEELLHRYQHQPSEQQRLRTFTPLLSYYCDISMQQASQALRIFRQMRQAPGVYLDSETYVMLLSSLARQGYFLPVEANNHNPQLNVVDDVMVQAGFSQKGPALLDAIMTEMADDLLELNMTAAVKLYRALHHAWISSDQENDDGLPDTLPAATQSSSSSSSLITLGRVTIDSSTRACNVTGAKLRLFALTAEQRTRVHDTLLEMASTQHEDFAAKMQERNKKKKRPIMALEASRGEYALEQLALFAKWVADQNFTAIIDGPNIAYFGHAVLRYSQVEKMVQKLESLGERPLVTMPHKYCQSTFYVASINQAQRLSEREQQVIANLKEKGQLYVVQEWCLDDYYWMIASVVAHSRNDTNGSLPGLRPLLITNDQMRDHKLTLLEPRLFRRWTSCHIVRYNFGLYDQDEWAEDREVILTPADSVSSEIQGNPTPDGRTAWHIPIAEWNENHPHDRFCISIASPKE